MLCIDLPVAGLRHIRFTGIFRNLPFLLRRSVLAAINIVQHKYKAFPVNLFL